MPWPKSRTATGFTPARRRAILARDKHTCQSCGGPATEVDHIVNQAAHEQARTDPNAASNGQALCTPCHHAKTVAESAAATRATYAKLKHPAARD